jgi:hypothetical protein
VLVSVAIFAAARACSPSLLMIVSCLVIISLTLDAEIEHRQALSESA